MPGTGQNSSVVDLLAESLEPGREDRIRHMFNAKGLRGPEIIWSPREPDLRNAQCRRFAAICRRIEEEGRLTAEDFPLEELGSLTEWLMMVRVVDDAADFVYDYYGKSIVANFGSDMTGRRVSDLKGHTPTFVGALYKAIIRNGHWVYSEHEPPSDVFVRLWQRMIVPLRDKSGQVVKFAVVNVPENAFRAGLELMVDPVMVIADDMTVLYSNRAAQMLFDTPAVVRPGIPFEKVTGIALDAPMSAEEMHERHEVVDRVELLVRGGIVERLVMTLSAAQHRSHFYYVAVFRLIGT